MSANITIENSKNEDINDRFEKLYTSFFDDPIEKLEDLENAKSELDSKYQHYKRKYKTNRNISLFIILLVVLVLIATNIFFRNNSYFDTSFFLLISFLILMLYAILMTSMFLIYTVKRNEFIYESEVLEKKIENYKKYALPKTEVTKDESNSGVTKEYFKRLVQINIDNLSEYYFLIKKHTDNSFTTCLWSGAAGLVFIFLGFSISIFSPNNSNMIAIIGAGSGIIIEFLTATFYFLYNKTIKELKGYHDSLISAQNFLLAFNLVNDIDDKDEKSKMLGQLLVMATKNSELKI